MLYQELYHLLFSAITDAVEELEALHPLAAKKFWWPPNRKRKCAI